jgi:DUF4097 and DUF4098 domain-containing protein YvlB
MMTKGLIKSAFTIGLLSLLLAVPVYGATVNKSIKIPNGGESDGASSVNGSITVGDGAVVTGSVNTVNGSIRVGNDATIENANTVNGSVRLGDRVSAEDLDTVNGSITVGENSSADGEIETVNGKINLGKGSEVSDDVSNVNGAMTFEGATIGGNVTTVNGDVELTDGAVIAGDLTIEKAKGWGFPKKKSRLPKIVIGPGCRVEGVIDLEREVKLYISETASVGGVQGVMSLDDAVRFEGARP